MVPNVVVQVIERLALLLIVMLLAFGAFMFLLLFAAIVSGPVK